MSDNNNRNPSLTKLLFAAGAGVIVGAIAGAAMGISRLLEEQQQEEPQTYEEKKCDSDDDNDGDVSHTSRKSTNASTPSKPLQQHLNTYYNNYVRVPRREMQDAKAVVESVKKIVLRYCHQKLHDVNILALRDTGSVADGTKVIKADNFDVMVHIELDPDVWQLEESIHTPGYWLVKKKNTSKANYPPSNLLSYNYFSPLKVVRLLQSTLNDICNFDSKYQIGLVTPTPDTISLVVVYMKEELPRKIQINLVPSIALGESWYEAKIHPSTSADPSYSRLWRESFSIQEERRMCLNAFPPNSCHLKCLMILKAVSLNHRASLAGLGGSHVLRTLLLHQLDMEDDWQEEALTERFFDLLMSLKQCLSEDCLPNYFCPQVNVLQDVTPQARDNAKAFIVKNMTPDGIVSMLKREYK